jgi:hypothetical protein
MEGLNMNNISSVVDKNQSRRVKSGEFLFMTTPSLEDKQKLYGISMGEQIKEFKEIFGKTDDMEIYKKFTDYIKSKKMEVEVLKEPNEYWVQVDKAYTEENNLIGIFSTVNKFQCMDMYYTSNIDALKDDIINYLNSHKEN